MTDKEHKIWCKIQYDKLIKLSKKITTYLKENKLQQ